MMADQAAGPKLDRHSKENRWYYKEIGNHISPDSRKLLEEYSYIATQEVDFHIYRMVIHPFISQIK